MEGRSTPQDNPEPEASTAAARPAPADPWRAFLDPVDGAEFLQGWLAIAANRIATAQAGALFLRGDGGRLGLAARWQVAEAETDRLVTLAEAMLRKPEPLLQRGESDTLLGYPIDSGGTVQGILVLALGQHPNGAAMRALMRELHWSCGWIEARLMQGQAALGRKQASSAQLLTGLLAACESHARFDGAALALVNAIPDLTGFDIAAIGMQRRGRVRLEALSRVAAFGRKAQAVAAYEAAMDEALAQGVPVTWPAPEAGRQMIDAAHRLLARDLGAGALISAPLLVRGQPVGVLLLERGRAGDAAVALADGTAEELQLVAAALAPLLKAKYDERRLLSGRLRDWAGRGLGAVFGRRPAISLATLTLALALTLPFLIQTGLRVRAEATLEGAEQQAAVAPVDGFLAEAPARAGQQVRAGDRLARLDSRDLTLEAAAAAARIDEARQALRAALSEGDRAAAAIATADLAEARAAADLTAARLARLTITAPIDGLIVSGDLSQRIGAPVSRGDTLFEVARQDGWRLRIEVSEFDLGLVATGQLGRAVLAGLPDRPVPFTVQSIAAVSDPGDGENRFRIEALVNDPPAGLRPGLKGVAKIEVGRSSLAHAWLRGTLVRLKLLSWRWLP
ncbi:HlyD family efflux transporter periplasmic adaptor subunit [Pseudooceanicola sp.]|uniref:HlyD family efflux transporter periplasmic adaptor subunit n=1 Tax=Pseudooceanicola sp. TaxID=1914328 RepID=UPI002633E3F2|nr:HlyD family efflux transporter periplasmic adaptor subunit [Pseudooceanicola sp.]MDF1855738.1 HlyD family efflux transporter periplasmic adaptor subunit [Pseudooceanicola sp.]